MIDGYWGLSLNILSIFFVSLWISLSLISVTTPSISAQLIRFHAQAKLRILWCLVILPWLICLASIWLLIVPELYSTGPAWLSSVVHWHHIYNFELLSWHGASLCVFGVIFSSICLVKLLKAIRANTHLDQLDFFIANTDRSEGLVVIESEECQAFTSGLFSPRSYITSGLQRRLSTLEKTVVAEHELAHARSHDPLKKYLFSLFAAFFRRSIAQQLNDDFSLALEQAADESVLSTVNDGALISKTLLKVSRLGYRCADKSEELINCQFSENPLSLRIRYLLSDNKGQSFPRLLCFFFAMTVTMLSTLSVDALHHLLEWPFLH